MEAPPERRASNISFLASPKPASQETDLHTQRIQQAREIPKVLLREKLRGSHQRRLVPALHRQKHGEHRHHGLSRPHISLKEPVHPPGRRHVAVDLLQHRCLGAGELEGELLVKRADELVRPCEDYSGPLDGLLVSDLCLDELEEEELVEGQAATGALDTGKRGRSVQGREGLQEARQPQMVQLPGEEILLIVDLLQEPLQIAGEDPPEYPLGDLLARGV